MRGVCTKNGSYCEKEKVRGEGGQGRCERRSEAFVKIKKKLGGGGVGLGDQVGCERTSEAFVNFVKIQLLFFYLFFLFFFGGGGGGRVGGGVRVDVNKEVKLL